MSTLDSLAQLQVQENLNDYLAFNGWTRRSEGTFGVLWSKKDKNAEVAIPRGIRLETGMWDGTIERIAYWQESPVHQVDKAIRRFWMDVSDFRASSSITRGNYIAAEAGSSLFTGAWKVLRASATTARGMKVAIGGNYSSLGDRSISGALFAQTEPGSYVLPLLVPMERVAQEAKQSANMDTLPSPEDFFESKVAETEQRRATRTMAQALTAVQQKLIEPAVEPSKWAIDAAVMAGASRELVKSLHDMVNEETVAGIDITFSWAPKLGNVPGTRKTIEIPRESADLLRSAAKQMRTARKPTSAALSGPIFALYHPKGADVGEATIEAAYKGRIRRIVVTLSGESLMDDAHRWFHTHETLLIEGAIRSSSAGLRVDSPTRVVPLGQTMLFEP